MSGKKSLQAMLYVIGFTLIVVGLAIDGPVSFALLGGAVFVFLVAILVAIGGNSDDDETGQG